MDDSNYLLKQINQYDEVIHNIFLKRMSISNKLITIDNKAINKLNTHRNRNYLSDSNNEYEREYNYLRKSIQSLDTNFKYKKLINSEYFMNMEMKNINIVCYQGIPFSYSESASKALFEGKTLINRTTFEDVFKSVHDGIADIGVVPIENSTAGYISDVYDLLLKYDLYINYSYIKKINHCLAGINNSNIDDIREVYSHPQAIMQCCDYIEKNEFRAVNETNTAVAAKKVYELNNKEIACICSPEAAEHYGLKILEKQINKKNSNYTRFAAISNSLLLEPMHNRISIVFTVPHKIGTLNNVLSIFTYYNINLLSIYSRPDLKNPWNYMFYLDFEGNLKDNDIKATLFQFSEELPYMKILGSYKA